MGLDIWFYKVPKDTTLLDNKECEGRLCVDDEVIKSLRSICYYRKVWDLVEGLELGNLENDVVTKDMWDKFRKDYPVVRNTYNEEEEDVSILDAIFKKEPTDFYVVAHAWW